ncbi:hypothetical protein ACHAWO_010558 [Cyclotella atomus]|uniref:Uncharacterized protein n=1 Tax=Cyclotella atomus TaxID=382360 RepID=A0ABD3PT94_9STRA
MSVLGQVYVHGRYGGGQDQAKGMKLLLRASELGSVSASSTLADMYSNGIYVARDCKKTTHYLELAAKGGNAHARYYLGLEEMFLHGKIDRAIKHWLLACEGGHPDALQGIRNGYTDGTASKADYEKALRSYQQYLDDVKSANRDKAAAHDEGYVYLLSTDDFKV